MSTVSTLSTTELIVERVDRVELITLDLLRDQANAPNAQLQLNPQDSEECTWPFIQIAQFDTEVVRYSESKEGSDFGNFRKNCRDIGS